MNEKIIDKIKKLLALSSSANEHEAANAAAAAAALMAKHQIDMASLEEPDDPNSFIDLHVVDDAHKRKVVWKGDVAFGAAAAFGCKYLWSGPKPVMVGYESDLAAVKYVYQYLVREINRLADKSWNEFPLQFLEKSREYKEAFRRGAASVVRQRLQESRKDTIREEKKKVDANMAAIVKVENRDQQIDDFFAELAKRTGTYTPNNKVKSPAGLQAGMHEGNKININRSSGLISGGGHPETSPKLLEG